MSEKISLVQCAQATQAESGCAETTARDGEADAGRTSHNWTPNTFTDNAFDNGSKDARLLLLAYLSALIHRRLGVLFHRRLLHESARNGTAAPFTCHAIPS
jgi:hypothetical protein